MLVPGLALGERCATRIFPGASKTLQSFCATTRIVALILVDAASLRTPTRVRPTAGRTPASPHNTLTRATIPAAPPQALRTSGHLDRRPASHSVSLLDSRVTAQFSESSSSAWDRHGLGQGMLFKCAASAAPVLANQPGTNPRSGTRDSLSFESLGRSVTVTRDADSALVRLGLRVRRVSVPPDSDFSGPVPRLIVHSRPHPSPRQRVVSMPNRLATEDRPGRPP